MSTLAASPRTVRCPACGGSGIFGPGNPFRPFCSERCKNLDFGAWASEAYRVQVKPEPDSGRSDPET